MNDDLQKEIDAQVKGGEKKQPEAFKIFKKTDLDDIVLKPKETALPAKAPRLGRGALAGAPPAGKRMIEKEEPPRPPRSIAELLKIERQIAKNPPKASPFPESKGPIVSSSEKVKFGPSSILPPKLDGDLNKVGGAAISTPADENEAVKTFNLDSPPPPPQGASDFPPLSKEGPPSKIAERLRQNVKNIDYFPKNESPIVRRLRTLRGDIQEAMQSGKATLVSMAAAEANRRAEVAGQRDGRPPAPPKIPSGAGGLGLKITAVVISILLIGGGAAAFYFLKKTKQEPVVIIENTKLLPALIPVQFETKINVDRHNPSYVRAAFDAERQRSKGNLNEIGNVLFTAGEGELEASLSTEEFFAAAAMRPPEELRHTLSPKYMVGIHRFPLNQTFLIFETDAYEPAASGVLSWERNLEEEVGKFLRSPDDFAYPSGAEAALNRRAFKDKVYKNLDTRGLFNEKGELLFFYTFINRKYLVLTTNPETLGEIVAGLAARTVSR